MEAVRAAWVKPALVLMSPLSPGPRLAVRVICGEEMVPRAVVDVALIAGASVGGVE
jgi:hypothetical protein